MATHQIAAPNVRMKIIHRAEFTPERIGRLHAMANALMAEDEEHFRIHAQSNDVVHVFERTDTDEPVGFQFWKTLPMELPGHRAIVGGKLRIQPDFRGRALHLISGLRFFIDNQIRHPFTRYYRLSLASIFGFVSITSALREYVIFNPQRADPESRAIKRTFLQLAEESHFRLDEKTGLFFVDIFMTPETVSRYPASYFDKPGVKVYATVNPEYRSNGCYVGFWFRFSPGNLRTLIAAILRSRSRASS